MKNKNKKRIFPQIISLAAIIATGTALAACSGSGASDSGSTTTADSGSTTLAAQTTASSEGSKKDTLIYSVARDVGDVNVHLYDGDMMAQSLIFEALVRNTFDGIKPWLAESWDISEDGKEYTFHLKKDVKFTDGEPFNAEAVKLNFDAVMVEKELHSWLGLTTYYDSTEVVDDYTVKLKLTAPYNYTLADLALPRPFRFMSPKAFIDGNTNKGVSYIAGTGVYKLGEQVVNQYTDLVANEDYWGDKAKINTFKIKVSPSGQTTYMALKSGEVDLLFGTFSSSLIDAESYTSLQNDGEFQVAQSGANATRYLITNAKTEKEVKQAVWSAVNREELTATIYEGKELPAYRLFERNLPYCDIDLEERGFDVDKSKKILEGAGYTMGGSGFYEKDGSPLNLNLVYNGDSADNKASCEYIQSNLKEAGISATLVEADSTSIYEKKAAGDYDLMLLTSWGWPYDPQNTLGGLNNFNSFGAAIKDMPCEKEVLKNLDIAYTSTNEDDVKKAYGEILKTAHEECFWIPLSYTELAVIAPKNLKGVEFDYSSSGLPIYKYSFE